MDHYDAAGNGIGGGEILDVIEYFRNLKSSLPFMDNSLIMQYKLMPLILLTIIVLIVAVLIRIIMRIFNINRLNKGKGIMNELSYAERLRKHDESILRWNAIISSSTRLVEKSIFKTNKKDNEYTAYNLERAGIKTPGGYRTISPEEWNAVIVVIASCLVAIGLVITLFANYMIGALFIIVTIVFASVFPMIYLRNLVKVKDDEIEENFSDFYLMLHYTLLAGSKSSLVGTMKSYAKTTNSVEMQRLVDVCTHYMETYGEYEGTKYIAKAYREVPVIGKLMRLIRQAFEGGSVEQELLGFRQELLNEKRYMIQKRTDKLIARAQASFSLLMPILIQAILSAMSIYISDMGLMETFLG